MPLSRREFLRTGAALTAAAALPPSLGAEEKDPFGGFTLAIQSYTFRNFKFDQALKKIADLGIKHAELFRAHIDPGSSPDQIKAALHLCKDHGVTPIAFGVEGFGKNHDENKKKFEFGAAIGVKSLSADPEPAEECFKSLDKLCEEYKIAIAIHPHGPDGKGQGRHRWWSAEVILKAVKDHHELIGTCLDTGHLIRMAQLGETLDPAQQVRVMGARNFGMHLKDHNNDKKTDVVYGKDGGVLNVTEVLKALREVKFKGYIAIEYEAKPQEPSADVAACIAVFKESVQKLG